MIGTLGENKQAFPGYEKNTEEIINGYKITWFEKKN